LKKLRFHSINFKLTLSFLVVGLTGIALVAAAMWSATSVEFNRFISDRGLSDYTTAAKNYYVTHQSWDGVADALHSLNTTALPNPNGSLSRPDSNNNMPPPQPYVLVDQNGVVVAPSGPIQVGEQLSINQYQSHVAITVNNKTVGYVLVTGRPVRPNTFETRFLQRMSQSLILAALGAAVIAILLGLLLARSITRPIRDLTKAAKDMASGNLNQQVRVRSKDELGELTQAFNQMSVDLEHSNQLRRQMTADIAHDLRTPLSVITGYLEGLKDGVIKPTLKRFTAMYEEAIYLQRLVEDLRILSLADAGELSMNRQPVQLGDLINRLAESFQRQAELNQIQLRTTVDEPLPPVNIDPERMQQAMGNLVSNALRYTPAGGEILLSARQVDDHIQMEVKDSGKGIEANELAHIFDRFYRGDESRQEGGSGLGLAIAKSLIELQGGKISAASEGSGNGSVFTILLPC
jgi:signal transduction histidine kinase